VFIQSAPEGGAWTIGSVLRKEADMRSAVNIFIRRDDGQDLIEYALLCSLLGVACITGILNLSRILEFFARLGLALDAAA
jgi:Flp pilus assembly pilin Flp